MRFLLQLNQEVLKQARERNLLSDEHLTVDGTLIEARSSLKSFQRKEQEKQENGDEEKDRGNANVNFRGEKRSNQTHESKTDPDAKLARKGDGKEAKLSYNGNLLVCKAGSRPTLDGRKHQSDSFADVCGNGPRLPG